MAYDSVRQLLVASLWHGRDPFAVPLENMPPVDPEGWNFDHPYLPEAIDRCRPAIVVEVGVWKGSSVIAMARQIQALDLDCVVLAVDTWLGSLEFWRDRRTQQELFDQYGRPRLYETFFSNVMAAGVAAQVLPLALDSLNACTLLDALGIHPSVVHVDAAHEEAAVRMDIERWWRLLCPGGMLIMDDYDPSGTVWPGVRAAVDEFRAANAHCEFAASPYKCRMTKPRGTVAANGDVTG